MQPKSLFLGVLLLSMGFIGCAQNANLPVDLGLSVNCLRYINYKNSKK